KARPTQEVLVWGVRIRDRLLRLATTTVQDFRDLHRRATLHRKEATGRLLQFQESTQEPYLPGLVAGALHREHLKLSQDRLLQLTKPKRDRPSQERSPRSAGDRFRPDGECPFHPQFQILLTT